MDRELSTKFVRSLFFSNRGALRGLRTTHPDAKVLEFIAQCDEAVYRTLTMKVRSEFLKFAYKADQCADQSQTASVAKDAESNAGGHIEMPNDPNETASETSMELNGSSTGDTPQDCGESTNPNLISRDQDGRVFVEQVGPSTVIDESAAIAPIVDPAVITAAAAVVSTPRTGDLTPRKFSFRLKGGKLQAGVPYEGCIESSDGAPGTAATILAIHFSEETGLIMDPADRARIVGTPAIGGDVTVRFDYRIEPPGTDSRILTSSIDVFVNHDPKTLWKELPSDDNDPFWKPDTDTALLQSGQHRLIAASKRGRSHAHEGKFRDDDFKITVSEDGWTVIAVADGAGSASKSRRGSQIAVERVTAVLMDKLSGDHGRKLENALVACTRGELSHEMAIWSGLYPVLGDAAFEAFKAIEAEASSLSIAPREFSTTLLATINKKTEYGHLFATYWVGDGGVGIYQGDKPPILLGRVDSGEFAGQTRFLDSKVMSAEEISSRLAFAVVDEFKALVAMTDGISDPWFATDNNLESAEYWGKLWVEIEPALNAADPQAALRAWLDFWSPGNHDDRTIAVLW